VKVYTVPSNYNNQVKNMMSLLGHVNTNQPSDADLFLFTGGADVHPSLYGEKEFEGCNYDIQRDIRERVLFNIAVNNDIPMIGICRGGQFLNVMSGGKLWHDVDNHGRHHDVIDVKTNKHYQAIVSTHHQMMIPGPTGEVLAYAKVANRKRRPGYEWKRSNAPSVDFLAKGADGQPDPTAMDIEAVWYEDTRCLCYQPHPEYNPGDTRTYFVELMNRFITKEAA